MEAFTLASGWKINVSNANDLTSTVFSTTFVQKPTKNNNGIVSEDQSTTPAMEKQKDPKYNATFAANKT